MRLFRRRQFSQEGLDRRRGIRGSFNFLVEVLELQTYPRQHFLIRQKAIQQLLPLRDFPMFEHQFQSDVLKEQVFSSTEDGGQALLLLFGHGKEHCIRGYKSNAGRG